MSCWGVTLLTLNLVSSACDLQMCEQRNVTEHMACVLAQRIMVKSVLFQVKREESQQQQVLLIEAGGHV